MSKSQGLVFKKFIALVPTDLHALSLHAGLAIVDELLVVASRP